MLPTHTNAVELNVLHRKQNDNKNCANGRELLMKNNGLIGRRLANNIPPIDINIPCDNTSIPSTSLIVSKSSKFLDIGFKNLSYTATTGLFKRSEYNEDYGFFELFNRIFYFLCFNIHFAINETLCRIYTDYVYCCCISRYRYYSTLHFVV